MCFLSRMIIQRMHLSMTRSAAIDMLGQSDTDAETRSQAMSKKVIETGESTADELHLGTLENALGFLLLAGWRDASRHFAKHFEDAEITPASFGVLGLIGGNPGVTIASLCAVMGITPNNMNRIIGRLEERKLVLKFVAEDDRRVRSLCLTRKGQEYLEKLTARHGAYEAEFDKHVGAQRAEQLRALLRFFVANDAPAEQQRK